MERLDMHLNGDGDHRLREKRVQVTLSESSNDKKYDYVMCEPARYTYFICKEVSDSFCSRLHFTWAVRLGLRHRNSLELGNAFVKDLQAPLLGGKKRRTSFVHKSARSGAGNPRSVSM